MLTDEGFCELFSFVDEDLAELQGDVIVRQVLQKFDHGFVEKFLKGSLKDYLYVRDNAPWQLLALD
jgi:hypothetical protein